MKIGVLALQGAYKEHIDMLKKLNVYSIEVRNNDDLENIDGIIIPGGESTTIGKLLKTLHIYDNLKEKINNGLPVWGTCAGMILLANSIENQDSTHLSVMNIVVKRNAYGRQLGSFNVRSYMNEIGDDVEMIFIRAPYITSVSDNVKVLSVVDNNIVAAKQDNMLVTSFHPELSDDTRVHEYFIDIVKKYIN